MTVRPPREDHRPDSASLAMIRESRAAIAVRPVDLAAAVYRHLPSFAPRTKELLAADVRMHGERIVRELLRAAEVLDALASLEEDLRQLGAEHATHHGVSAELGEHFPYLGQALVRAVRELFPNSEGGPLGSAWLEVFEWLADEMLRGAVLAAPAYGGVTPSSGQSPSYRRSYVEEAPGASAWPDSFVTPESFVAPDPFGAVEPLEPVEARGRGRRGPAAPGAVASAPSPADAATSAVAEPSQAQPAAGGGAGVDPAQDPTVSFQRAELFERLARADEVDAKRAAAEAAAGLAARTPRPVAPTVPTPRGAQPAVPRPVSPARPGPAVPRPVSPARPGPAAPRQVSPAGPVARAAVPPVPPADPPGETAGRPTAAAVGERPRRSRNPWTWASRSRRAEQQRSSPDPWPPPPRIDPAMYDSPPEVAPPHHLDPRRPEAPEVPSAPAPRAPTSNTAAAETTTVGESAVLPPAEPDPGGHGTPGGALRGVGTGWPRVSASRPVRPARNAEPNPTDLSDAPAQE